MALGMNKDDPSHDNDEVPEIEDSHHVNKASYPIPQPLARLLNVAIFSSRHVNKESMQEALAQLVGNSIEAMDAMYFATPAHARNRPSFEHRLCLRVEASSQNKTLTLTDLGSGMTRADLINGLGVGHLSHRALAISRKLQGGRANIQDYEQNVDEDESSTSSSEEEEDDNDQDEEDCSSSEEEQESLGEEEQNEQAVETRKPNGGHDHSVVIPCKATDLGGFYSALCALGIGVNVGTKASHDDYYEFDAGQFNEASAMGEDESTNVFEHFLITRPMKEGVKPSLEQGFDRFVDVRGDSGTRVTIRLNDDAIAAGWLDEQVLRPIFQHILETTNYTVAFSSDAEEAQAIVEASRKEELDKQQEAQEQSTDGENVLLVDSSSDAALLEDEGVGSHNTVKERSKYIPVRLSLGERKMLRLVEAAMTCCDYTTVVDRPFKGTARRTHAQLKGITSVLRGLVTACDYSAGQKLFKDDNFAEYEVFFRQMFEIARRHKIMNPEKMRTEYGKLVCLLQDAVSPSVQPHLGFSCKGKIETVYKFLEERQGLAVLDDKLIEMATQEILAEKKTRAKINNEIRRKERAVAALKQKYRSSRLSSEDIHLCLYSICDNNSFLNSNRVPIDKVIDYLKKFFSPEKIEEGYSLSIISGKDGARLSHSHERQYTFALQSLTLWRDIIDDMFRLWHMAEEDLLSETVTYALKDTGQGMQRVQQSPRTYKAMQQILLRVQGKVKHWVGSSVIHMGDHNVPNALSFIDKYTQVPRILGPIVICLENLERICEKDQGIKEMVDTGYGGMEKLRKDILYDFFKSAFDGSGADNFYDAGSCIDGRLTSAWNWCSQLPNKRFYPIFKLTGFTGFDGEFK